MENEIIRYEVGITHPHRHFISFSGKFPVQGKSTLFQLAAWRPGRYELGNFSKSIRQWKAEDVFGNKLVFRKLNKDLWEVDCEGLDEIVIAYQYYAPDINAGSSYLDDEQLYLNPVNCFFFLPEYPELASEIKLLLPESYQVATGMRKLSTHVLAATNFDELADCPVIASASLQHVQYEVDKKTYHIWLQGTHPMDTTRMLREFEAFTRVQLNIFGSIPCEEYHFLFQITPYFVRHGVEHRNSTVIAMGPAADLAKESWYRELLGISCHELFHTWNVKCFRPTDMVPYDFSGENYSRLGYIYEGVTTYYGDLLLLRSGVFDDAAYFDTFHEVLEKHFDNPGRHNHSVADSSFDTWLDGYGAGIPWRKVSIYTEGCLIAFICDVRIRSTNNNKYSLDDVMKKLYGQVKVGYDGFTEEEYQHLLEDISGTSFADIFSELVHGTSDYTPYLNSALHYLGLELKIDPNMDLAAHYWGIQVEKSAGKMIVANIIENSPADTAGMWIGDQLLTINGNEITPETWSGMISEKERSAELTLFRKGREHSVCLVKSEETYFAVYTVGSIAQPTPDQNENLYSWKVN